MTDLPMTDLPNNPISSKQPSVLSDLITSYKKQHSIESKNASDRNQGESLAPQRDEKQPSKPSSALIELIAGQIRDKHFSQKELATRSGIAQPNLSAILSGKRQPSLRSIEAILEAIGCEVFLVSRRK
jgi:predicted XRE-type DNA-binding protein